MIQENGQATAIVTDEDEIKYEDQEDEEIATTEIPKKVRVLQTQAYDKSVSDLVSMMKSHDISLDPDYQRNYIWDNKKASLLIESILLNVPIPVIYVAEDAVKEVKVRQDRPKVQLLIPRNEPLRIIRKKGKGTKP